MIGSERLCDAARSRVETAQRRRDLELADRLAGHLSLPVPVPAIADVERRIREAWERDR
jgi:hypothetical protein